MRVTEWLKQRGRGREGAASASTRDVIAAGKQLASAGDYYQAIEMLTAENRNHRSRELDQLLLSLRSEGALAMDWNSQPPVWPAEVPDLFGGEGIPEVRGDALTAAAVRSGIVNRGSLIVRQLLTTNQTTLLRDNIDHVLRAFDATATGIVPSELEGWYQPFERDTLTDIASKRKKGAILTVHSAPALFDLLECFEACGLSAVIRDFFGEPPMLLSRKGTLRRVQPDVRLGGWHQDGGFLGEDIRSLNIWVALTDCGVDAPGMDIVAKRLPGLVPTGSKFAAWATNPQAANEIAAGCTQRPVFNAGDAILFDHLCLHRTAGAPGMTKTRYAIETWIMAPSTYTKGSGVPVLF